MAQLPTPTVSGSFSSTSRVDGTVTWPTATNLNDLDQVRVRYARSTERARTAPSATTLGSSGLGQRVQVVGVRGSTGGRSYGYRDDVLRSGLTDRVAEPFNETGLTGYNVWAIARLEV